MPMNRRLYPKDWEVIALKVKQSANWKCEQCHRHCRKKGESKQDFRSRLTPSSQAEFDTKPQRFILTTSHQDHNPANCNSDNLKALCSVCHLRYDAEHHAETRANKKPFKQLSLFEQELTP